MAFYGLYPAVSESLWNGSPVSPFSSGLIFFCLLGIYYICKCCPLRGTIYQSIVVCGADSINPHQSKSSNPTASHKISMLAGGHFLV